MHQSLRLLALGILLLTAAFALPFVDFVTAEWDRDYRYRISTDGFCADAVAEVRDGDTSSREGFVVTRQTLSQAALVDVRRAERRGSYTVENKSDADGPFTFATDHQARGLGCYAIRDSDTGDSRALVTEAVNHRTDRFKQRAVPWVGRSLAAAGVLSLLAGGTVAARRWMR